MTKCLGLEIYQELLSNLFAIHLLRHYCAFQPVFKSYDGGLSAVQLRQVLDYIHAHLGEDINPVTKEIVKVG